MYLCKWRFCPFNCIDRNHSKHKCEKIVEKNAIEKLHGNNFKCWYIYSYSTVIENILYLKVFYSYNCSLYLEVYDKKFLRVWRLSIFKLCLTTQHSSAFSNRKICIFSALINLIAGRSINRCWKIVKVLEIYWKCIGNSYWSYCKHWIMYNN